MPEVPWGARPIFYPKRLAVGQPGLRHFRGHGPRHAIKPGQCAISIKAGRLGRTPRLADFTPSSLWCRGRGRRTNHL